jgi:hypothetical protein
LLVATSELSLNTRDPSHEVAKDASLTNTNSSNSSIHTTESGSSEGGSSPSQSGAAISSPPSGQPLPSTTENSKVELNLPKAINMRDTPLPILSEHVNNISVRPLAEGGYSNVWQGTLDEKQPVSGRLLARHF